VPTANDAAVSATATTAQPLNEKEAVNTAMAANLNIG
jgi:hypothetical protein